MASFSGVLHRPLSAAAAVAVAAVTSDFSERFGYSRSSDSSVEKLSAGPVSNSSKEHSSWVSHISVSNIPTRPTASSVQSLTADSRCSVPNSNLFFPPNSLFSSFSSPVASVPVLRTRYQYAKLAKPPKSTEFTSAVPSSSPDVLYRWHIPDPMTCGVSGDSTCGVAKSQTLVVLLGWLGAKQKHLKRYADWYTSRGFNVVTFTFPMAEVVSYKVGGKAEQNVHLLANHLAEWVGEEHGKNLVFHTFSNTGWLTYGAILEKFQRQDPSLMEKIKGCIVDSAPVAAPDPQVWASGFSAALLKKQSVATKGSAETRDSKEGIKPAVTELALLGILEKFFEVVLNLPSVNRRLSGVLDRLSSEQPRCPQLYIYSSSDKVIPAKSVESFIEQQRRAGHEVRACDFVSSPHVDHFRNHPNLYSSQLSTFLEDHVLTCCKDSSP